MFNPNIQSVVVRADIPLKSKNRFKCSTLCIPGMEAADFEANSHRAPCTILGKVIRCLRPELDLYLIVDADGAETPAEAHDSFRRVFYSPEDDLELYLSIRQGVLERYQTPFFSALKAHSQRPTGVFHAMPLSRAIPCFNRIGFRI